MNSAHTHRASGHFVVASSWLRALALMLIIMGAATVAQAQGWRQHTLRDSIFVPANRTIFTSANAVIAQNSIWQLDYYGTYSAFAGQDSSQMDAAYSFSIPNLTAPYPLPNPPTFGSTSYSVYTEANYDGKNAVHASFFETSAQNSHHYTWRQASTGAKFSFRLNNRLNERSDGYYYGQSHGGIKIVLTQFTAGVCVQNHNVEFGMTNIGFPTVIVDSMASFGLDPLQIDKIWIDGADASAFTITSQRGDQFTLSNEAVNVVTIKFSPQRKGDHFAVLHIHSPNADPASRTQNIALHGIGGSPALAIGPDSLNFGKVRIATTPQQMVTMFNGGNAALQVTSVTLTPAAGTPNGVFSFSSAVSFSLQPNNAKVIPVTFRPPDRQKYQATLVVNGVGVPSKTVILTGEGAAPNLSLHDAELDFDTLYSDDQATRTTSITNTGNWTAHITVAKILGGSQPAFHFTPDDSDGFFLNSGETRNYTIIFQPNTHTDGPHVGYLTFTFDDGSPSKQIQLNGYELKRKLELSSHYIDFGRVKINKWPAPARSIYVRNNSTNPIPLSVVLPDLPPPAWSNPFAMSHQPSPLQPGFDSVTFTFRPTLHGPFSDWAYFGSEGQRDSVYLVGFGAQPLAKFSPNVVNLGVVLTNQTATGLCILSDTGDYPLYVRGVRVTGPDAGDFTASYLYSAIDTIHEGGIDARNIGITFSTSERTGRTHHAIVQLIYDDSTRDQFDVYATEAAQHARFTPPTYAFGKVRVGTVDSTKIGVANGSNTTLSVQQFSFIPSVGPFSIVDTSLSMNAQSTATTTVLFAPTAKGTFQTRLAGTDVVADTMVITGIGAQSEAKLSTNNITFGTTPIQSTSASQPLVLSNVGDWTLAATLTKLNDPYDEFEVSGPRGMISPSGVDTVLEGDSSLYTITFTPKHAAYPEHTAVLALQFDDGTTQNVTLHGKDISLYLALDSNTINFGKVRVGTAKQEQIHLVNTTVSDLTATQLKIFSSASAPFSATPDRNVLVQKDSSSPVTVTFKPSAMGTENAFLVGQGVAFNAANTDTVWISGIGAMPIPTLADSALDFDTIIVGNLSTKSTVMTNTGNWPLITHMTISGPNAADFTVHYPTDTTLAESGHGDIVIDFTATTPLQYASRVATVTFTMDDSTTKTLELVAHDRVPLPSMIGFGNYIGRPGDKILVYLRSRSTIPADKKIQDVKGSVTFDPAVAKLLSIERGSILASSEWQVNITNQTDNGFDYEFTSSNSELTAPGALLTLTFEVQTNVKPGDRSALLSACNFPASKEVAAIPVGGVILVDSACGSTHVYAGLPHATFVQQNVPNPFGGHSRSTSIPFDVADDGATVTLRVYDVTGHVVSTPLDHQHFTQGRYSVQLDARTIGSGTYYYEFQIDGYRPQIMKMMVE